MKKDCLEGLMRPSRTAVYQAYVRACEDVGTRYGVVFGENTGCARLSSACFSHGSIGVLKCWLTE